MKTIDLGSKKKNIKQKRVTVVNFGVNENNSNYIIVEANANTA